MPVILSRKLRLACLMFVLVCVVGCDQTSKRMARARLRQTVSVTLPGGLVELRLAENRGAFLSLGSVLPAPARFAVFTVGVGVGLLALVGYLTGRAPIDMTRYIGLSLLVAGGMSNLLDRIFRHGLVTDFVTVHIGPFHTGVFNAADALIMIGIGVFAFTLRKQTLPEVSIRE